MAPTLAVLRSRAKQAGIPASEIRGASAEDLQDMLDANGKPRKKVVAKKKVSTQRKRGNVRKSGRSKSSPAAKSHARGKAKRATAAPKRNTAKRSTRKRAAVQPQDDNMGRFTLNGVDFGYTEGWNARAGSPPDRIIKMLKAKRGNREKVFEALKSDIWAFMGRKKRDGTKRTKVEAEAMLKYRISRTAWDFAMRTGQHEASSNREQYGTAGTGMGVWKPARKRAAQKRSQATKRGGARRTAPKRSAAQKRSQSARKAPKRQATKRQTAKRGSAKRRMAKR
jgi:hypothetical protein